MITPYSTISVQATLTWTIFDSGVSDPTDAQPGQRPARIVQFYYYKLGLMLGIDRIDEWARQYGLGEYTGIDLPGEIVGMRSNPENKRLTRVDEGDKIWNPLIRYRVHRTV